MVLDNLATGVSVDEVIKSYPSLTVDAIRAAVAYAAELTRERIVPFPSQAMQFKTDENLPVEVTELLREAGYDAMSVLEQGMGGK